MKPSLEELHTRLQQYFPDAQIQLRDDSHHHIGHAGATGGAGHFTVEMASRRFDGLSTVARHRLVYDALADWMPGRIHALRIRANTPHQ
ncbi:MAG: BolA family protein [Lautropia sp.]|nr:BolA family protein [Lautropia sp.]